MNLNFLFISIVLTIFQLVTAFSLETNIPFSFAIFTDVPYPTKINSEEQEYKKLIKDISEINNAKIVDFFVHLGDIKAGMSPCKREQYELVGSTLRKCESPVFMIIGDNEMKDCSNQDLALKWWKDEFLNLHNAVSNNFEVKRQRERVGNFMFIHKEVLFIGFHNTKGIIKDTTHYNSDMDKNVTWLLKSFKQFGEKAKAAVIFTHAKPAKYFNFFKPFADQAKEFNKPILLLHGNRHFFEIESPFLAENITRVSFDNTGYQIPSPIVTVNLENSENYFEINYPTYSRKVSIIENYRILRRKISIMLKINLSKYVFIGFISFILMTFSVFVFYFIKRKKEKI